MLEHEPRKLNYQQLARTTQYQKSSDRFHHLVKCFGRPFKFGYYFLYSKQVKLGIHNGPCYPVPNALRFGQISHFLAKIAETFSHGWWNHKNLTTLVLWNETKPKAYPDNVSIICFVDQVCFNSFWFWVYEFHNLTIFTQIFQHGWWRHKYVVVYLKKY